MRQSDLIAVAPCYIFSDDLIFLASPVSHLVCLFARLIQIAEDMFGSKHRASVEGIKLSKPGYGEYSGSDATSVTEAEPRGPSELSETQDGGFSTMGSEYSEYASAVGRHKTSETGLLESGGFRSREHSRRYVDQTVRASSLFNFLSLVLVMLEVASQGVI